MTYRGRPLVGASLRSVTVAVEVTAPLSES
jgi:hypothetical protein